MKRAIALVLFATALAAAPSVAMAADFHGQDGSGLTGQPDPGGAGISCQNVYGVSNPPFPAPAGFNTGTTTGGAAGTGFAMAGSVYAGSGQAATMSGNTNAQTNTNAISQYDVACFQTSTAP